MFVSSLAFLVMVLKPLGMTFCQALDSLEQAKHSRKSVQMLGKALGNMISTCTSRGFTVTTILCDGEKAVRSLVPELNSMGHFVSIAAAGGHVHVVERKIQVIKSRVRSFHAYVPYVMPKLLEIYCVYFCVQAINNYITEGSIDNSSPRQWFL